MRCCYKDEECHDMTVTAPFHFMHITAPLFSVILTSQLRADPFAHRITVLWIARVTTGVCSLVNRNGFYNNHPCTLVLSEIQQHEEYPAQDV